MLKILIVDDEPLARERIVELISECGIDCTLQQAENGLVAIHTVTRDRPDVLLLDIRMPVMDGLEVAQHLAATDNPPAVIFTTAYQDHALQAFDMHAIDYLLKPVRLERLKEALERASILQQSTIRAIRKKNEAEKGRTHLSTHYKGELVLIPVDQIRYLQADQKYVIAGWPQGEQLLDESLVNLEEELAGQFIRIHRNCLVALRYIDGLTKNDDGIYCIALKGSRRTLPISRRNLGHIRKILKDISH